MRDGHHPVPSNDTGQPPPTTQIPQVSQSTKEVVVHNCGKSSAGFTLVVPVKINGLEVSAVVDTAAEATIVSRAVYEQLKTKPDLTREVVLIGLDRSSGIWGQLMISDLTIGSHTLKWQAYVADMPDQCLLGLDFLIHYGVDIQLSKNSIMVMGEEILATLQKTTSGTEVQVGHVSLKKHTVVPPNTIKYVIGKCAWDITGDVILQPSIKHPKLLIP